MNLSTTVRCAALIFGLSTAVFGCTQKEASTSGAASPSSASASTLEPANEATATSTAGSLGAILAGATSVHVGWAGPKANAGNDADVTDAAEVAKIVAALGPSQAPATTMSRCMPPTTLAFKDAKGELLATVGLCDASGLAANNQSQARIDRSGARAMGLDVKDLAALRAVLASKGVVLP